MLDIMRIIVLSALLGCSPPKKNGAPKTREDIPILPSPNAELYAVGNVAPKDWLVAQQSEGLPWDEALSGAAAKMGLDFADSPTVSAARWVATQAGYPYLVEKIIVGRVSASQVPEGLHDAIKAQVSLRGHVGLARVRRGSDDFWVALIGKGGTKLPTLSRFFSLNGEFRLDIPGLDWLLLSPSGRIYSGNSSIDVPLSEVGEWWLELRNRGERISSLPLYVGITDPPTNLFSDFQFYPETPEDVEKRIQNMINVLRRGEGLSDVRLDGALKTLGLQPLEDESKRDAQLGLSRLVALGYPEEFSYQGVCVDDSVGTCLDALSWDINARRILLHPDVNLLGVQSEIRTDRITIVLTLSHM